MGTTLTKTLDELYKEEVALGYIEPHRLKDNLYFNLPDEDYHIEFKAQVNYLRDHYVQDMAQQKKQSELNCPLCFENQFLPGKEKMRIKPLRLTNHKYFAQLSPYPLFKHHCVIVSREHYPMQMSKESLIDLIDFVDQAPEYTACSNSDVPWAGASILQHHHYQAFKSLHLPIQTAKPLYQQSIDTIQLELLHYPIACARLITHDKTALIKLGGQLITQWKAKRQQNTCNLLLSCHQGSYHLYIIFRHPDFRTPIPIKKVKSEGIGIVEVCGYAIYPVPHGDNSEVIWDKINNDGLNVIKTLISGNSPIQHAEYHSFWSTLCQMAETQLNENTQR